jgi:hypothetical protein
MKHNDLPNNSQVTASQNAKLANYLLTGHKINIYSDARRELGIGVLSSRMGSLRKYFGLKPFLDQTTIEGTASNGNYQKFEQYFIPLENINGAKDHLRSMHRKFYAEIIALST